MSTPAISVVMPVYNGSLYLREAIDSILNQTFTDFEFIIVNDGSTDQSEEIILSYTDNRIKYIKQENKGIGLTLRLGCSLAQGKYIARMDADDISNKNRLQIQYDYLEKNPEVVLLSSAVRYINENGENIGRSFPCTDDKILKKIIKNKGSPICHPAVMMRADTYKKSGGYCDLQPLEDYYLWLKLSLFGRIINLSTPYLYYRILSNSVSRSISAEQYACLKNFLWEKIEARESPDNFINEFKKIYNNFKADEIYNKNVLIRISSDFEKRLYGVLSLFFFPESFIEKLLCFFKNQRMKIF